MNIRCLLALSLALWPAAQALAEYQGEVAAAYYDRDYDDPADLSGYGLFLRYYLSPVKAEDAPIQLAPFMERQSFLFASRQKLNLELGNRDQDQETTTAGGDFQLGESPFRLGGGITRWDFDGEATNEYFANADWYYHRHGALSLLGSRRSNNDDLNEVDVSETGLSVAQVVALGNGHLFLQGRVLRRKSELQFFFTSNDVPVESDSQSIHVAWYPTRGFGLGVLYNERMSDYSDLRNESYDSESSSTLLIIELDPSDRLGIAFTAGQGNESSRLVRYDGMGDILSLQNTDMDYKETNLSLTLRF